MTHRIVRLSYPPVNGVFCFNPVSQMQLFCSASVPHDQDSASDIDMQLESSHEIVEWSLHLENESISRISDNNNTNRRGRRQTPSKLEDTICRMMTNRGWTTRLQNSIRRLVPEFNHTLIWNVLHSTRSTEHALQFFRWVERTGFRHSQATHFKIIQILSQASKLNHARCILLGMPVKGVKCNEDMFVSLIEGYGQAGIVQESVKIFQKMKDLGVERTIKSYDALFKVILRRGRYMMAKRYFNAMLREGVEPDCHIYNVMLWGFFLSSRVETANRFFQEMMERGILPDVVTYNTMINGYNRTKKLKEAENLFAEMKGKDIEPNVISYTSMIKGNVSVGRVDGGMRLLDEMRSKGIKPNAVTYSTILPGLCDMGRMIEARGILRDMVDRDISPKDNSIFTRLLFLQCKFGFLDAASEVLSAMIRLHVPTEAGHYGILIENLCKVGNYEKAVKYLDKVVEKDIVSRLNSSLDMESNAYNPIIEYLSHNGKTQKAETFFRQLMKKGVQDPVAFNNLIRGHASEGAPSSSFEILNIMRRQRVPTQADSYELLIRSFLNKGEPADAKQALDSMIEDGHLPNSSLFRSVMVALFDDGRVQTASRVMKSMIEKGVKDNLDLVSKILEALFMREHVEEALGRIDLMMNYGYTPDFDNLLRTLCEEGMPVVALKLLDYCLERNHTVDFSCYDRVLDALLAAGKTIIAYSILRKILAKGAVTCRSSSEELIKALNKQGYKDQAGTLSRIIMENGKGIRGKRRASSLLG